MAWKESGEMESKRGSLSEREREEGTIDRGKRASERERGVAKRGGGSVGWRVPCRFKLWLYCPILVLLFFLCWVFRSELVLPFNLCFGAILCRLFC
uniref:Uncharacterized protein n=1 Tax=Esox lucius TaxID=8010 RepID=A0A3P8YQH1_ESOLU